MTRAEELREWSIDIVSLLAGAVIFWLALHCEGSDWFISETHADVIYTGLRRFREYPFFSFVINGGSYFLQDPQSNLFSPVVGLIYTFGPSIGLRVMMGLWGVAGTFAFVVWMRRRVSLEAALIGGVSSALGLAVLWKVAVGNDMFLWHLGLPALLWGCENAIKRKNVVHALGFGLILGLTLMGPTFHSFVYLFLPAVPLFALMELVLARPGLKQLAATIALLLLSCLLAMMIAAPKLACWATFSMGRPIGDHGVIELRTALRGLFDYAWTKGELIDATSLLPTGEPRVGRIGHEEVAMALPPLASLLVPFGLFAGLRYRGQRSLTLYALVLLGLGLGLACWWPLWEHFRALSGGSFRVAPRFLGLASFGLAILATLGADFALKRLRERWVQPVAGMCCALVLASGVWWTRSAGRFEDQSPTDTVSPTVMNPRAVAKEERLAIAKLTKFDTVAKFNPEERAILDGVGYKDGFMVVGNRFKRRLWKTRHSRRFPKNAPGYDRPSPVVVEGLPLTKATFTHLRIGLKDIPPHTVVRLRALVPVFGMKVETSPPDAKVVVDQLRTAYMIVENTGDKPVRRVNIRATLPISVGWFIGSLVATLGTLAILITAKWRRHMRKMPSPAEA